MVHDSTIVEHDWAEFANGTVGYLFDIGAIRVHAMESGSDECRRPAAKNGVFASRGREDDLAVRQIAGMDIIRVPGFSPSCDFLCLVNGWKRNLPQARAVDIHFPDSKSGCRILAKIE